MESLEVDQKIKEQWLSIPIPRKEDLESQIERLNDKNWKPVQISYKHFKPVKRVYKGNEEKRVKTLTNSHLRGVYDFTKIWKSPYEPK